MGASQSAFNIQKPSQTGPRTQGDLDSGKHRAADTPAISSTPVAVEAGFIWSDRTSEAGTSRLLTNHSTLPFGHSFPHGSVPRSMTVAKKEVRPRLHAQEHLPQDSQVVHVVGVNSHLSSAARHNQVF